MYIIPQEPAKVYEYNELSEKAKETAYESWRDAQYNGWGYPWGDEFKKSMEEFAKTFNLKLTDWQFSDCSPSYIDFEVEVGKYWEYNEDVENLSGIRLYKYIYNLLKNEWVEPNSKFHVYKNGKHMKFIDSGSQKVYEKNGKVRYSNIFREDNEEEYYSLPFTGSFADDYYRDIIIKFMKRPDTQTTYRDLMERAFNKLIRYYLDDEEYFYSEDNFKETDAQEKLYYEDGSEYGEYDWKLERYKVNNNVEFCIDND